LTYDDHPYVSNFGALITPKLKEREGFIFKEAPDFYRMDSSGHIQDGKDGPVKSMEDINEDYKEQEKDEKKLKKKKKMIKD